MYTDTILCLLGRFKRHYVSFSTGKYKIEARKVGESQGEYFFSLFLSRLSWLFVVVCLSCPPVCLSAYVSVAVRAGFEAIQQSIFHTSCRVYICEPSSMLLPRLPFTLYASSPASVFTTPGESLVMS